MEIKIYKDLETFELYHIDDFQKQNRYSYLQYLDILHRGYDKNLEVFLNEKIEKIKNINKQFAKKVSKETITQTTADVYEIISIYISNISNILKFIQLEKERQKTIIKLGKPLQEEEKEEDPLTENETDKIRLLHETGIINFLIDKYQTTNPNKIAKFFELISSEPMTAKNNNSLFTTDKINLKYPMNNLSITKKQKIRNLMLDFGFITELQTTTSN